jgi:hypothetical protein
MNRVKYIWILIMIYIVCTARTCNESEETTEVQKQEYTMNLMRSVKHVFTSASLSDHLLRAYEITATEKVIDFADYLRIISDTTLDLRFRQHAAELVRDLFISDETDLSGWSKSYPEPGLNVLKHLLSYSLSEGVLFWLKPIDINIVKPFTSINDSTFTGNLSFNYKSLYRSGQDTSEIASGKLVIDICLMKETRSFGKEQFRVWEVYLGNMKEDSEN